MSDLQRASWTMRKVFAKEVVGFLCREMKRVPKSREFAEKEREVEAVLEKWTLVGFFSQEEVFGVIGCDAEGVTHIHIAEAWQHFWQARSSFVRALSILFTEHEQLTSIFAIDNLPAKKLCQMVGAHLIGNDGKELTYMLSKADLKWH